jgi:MerR family transcriptional regulator, light-induced transcriptional regulator
VPSIPLLRTRGSDFIDSPGAVVSEPEDPPPPVGDQVEALTRAALELDQTAATTIMNSALRADGVVSTWTDVLAPALRRRGEQFTRTANGIAAEHLLSACTSAALSAVTWRRRRWNCVPPVLLAAPDGEQHVLPLQALAAALAEIHQPSVLLGASVPPRALLDAATQLEPTVIFLWAHSPGAARRADLALLRRRPVLEPPTLILGGPGWPRGSAGQVVDLAAAVQACTGPTLPVLRGSRARPDIAS